MEPWAIRDATLDDLEMVNQFLEPFVEQESLLPRTDSEIATLLKHGFIAEVLRDECLRTIGFAAVEIYSRKLAEIQALAVAPDYQGKGVGKALVNRCVERARNENVLELMAISSSEEFLKLCGFDYSLPNQKRALFIHPQTPS